MSFNRAGTRSRRPQGIFDDSEIFPSLDDILTENDRTGGAPGAFIVPGTITAGADGLPDQAVRDLSYAVIPLQFLHPVTNNPLFLDNTLQSVQGWAGENGFSTQNQRYLHLHIRGTHASVQPLELWGYNYTFGRWARLMLPTGQEDANNNVEYAPWGGVPTGGGVKTQWVIPIQGVDRIAFVIPGAQPLHPSVRVRAAVSSF